MPIDPQRMHSFLTRLQQAAQEALQRGDVGAAQKYSALMAQADKAVQAVVSGPMPVSADNQSPMPMAPQNSGQPKTANPYQGAWFMEGGPQDAAHGEYMGQQIPTPKTSPFSESVVQEGMQGAPGAMSSWERIITGKEADLQRMNTTKPMEERHFRSGVLGGPPNVPSHTEYFPMYDQNPEAPPPAQPPGLWSQDAGAMTHGGPPPSQEKKLYSPDWFAKKGKEAVGSAWDWLWKEQGGIKPGAYWDVLGERAPKPEVAAHGELPPDESEVRQDSADLFSPSSPNAANPGKPRNADPYQDANKGLVDADLSERSPASAASATNGKGWGGEDFLGLLMGGRNYLQYKMGQEERQKNRDFEAQQGEIRRAQEREEFAKNLDARQQALAVEYMRALNQQKSLTENRDTPEDKMERAIIGASVQLGADPKDPFFKNTKESIASRRANAIQLKRNQE